MELVIKDISKKYSDKWALKNFSCVFREGITAVLGPNGAGKSTLMNLITDNVRRDSGTILYENKDVIELGSRFRKILSYMPQDQGVYGDFPAKAFLHYIAELKGVQRSEAKQQISSLLDLVELTNVSHRKLASYSGGMKQRILLCQALLGDPKIVLLDEPTAGLDVEERIRISRYIEEFAKGRIILLSTHIVNDIQHDNSVILIIKSGECLAMNTLKELKHTTGLNKLSEIYLNYMNKDRSALDE